MAIFPAYDPLYHSVIWYPMTVLWLSVHCPMTIQWLSEFERKKAGLPISLAFPVLCLASDPGRLPD